MTPSIAHILDYIVVRPFDQLRGSSLSGSDRHQSLCDQINGVRKTPCIAIQVQGMQVDINNREG